MENRLKGKSLFSKITRNTIKIFIPIASLFSVSMTSTDFYEGVNNSQF